MKRQAFKRMLDWVFDGYTMRVCHKCERYPFECYCRDYEGKSVTRHFFATGRYRSPYAARAMEDLA